MPPWGGKLGAQFPILNDVRRDISRAYGVFDEETVVARRTTFVIDRQAVVPQVLITQEALGPTHALVACAGLTEVQ